MSDRAKYYNALAVIIECRHAWRIAAFSYDWNAMIDSSPSLLRIGVPKFVAPGVLAE